MPWEITLKDGKASVLCNGKPVMATDVQIDLSVRALPVAVVKFFLTRDDFLSLEMVEGKSGPVEKIVTLTGSCPNGDA